jgi:hypothetical protein
MNKRPVLTRLKLVPGFDFMNVPGRRVPNGRYCGAHAFALSEGTIAAVGPSALDELRAMADSLAAVFEINETHDDKHEDGPIIYLRNNSRSGPRIYRHESISNACAASSHFLDDVLFWRFGVRLVLEVASAQCVAISERRLLDI